MQTPRWILSMVEQRMNEEKVRKKNIERREEKKNCNGNDNDILPMFFYAFAIFSV